MLYDGVEILNCYYCDVATFKSLWKPLIGMLCCGMFLGCNHRNEISAEEKAQIVSLGHGGMGISSSYPLNSMEGLLKCLDLGLDGTELDLQMTADSVLVAFHDRDLSEDTEMEGLIRETRWSDLKTAEYIGNLRANCTVVALEDLFSSIDELSKYYFTFDCKLHAGTDDPINYQTQFARAISRMLHKFQLGERIAIESQDVDFLLLCEQNNPNCAYYIYPSSFMEGFETATDKALDGITMDFQKISASEIQQAHDANLKVALWNVKSGADNWTAINMKPDFIQSDAPRQLKNALK